MTELRLEELPGTPSVTVAYLRDYERVVPFYSRPPSPEVFQQVETLQHTGRKADRQAVASLLVDQNRSLGAGQLSLQNAQLLGQPHTLAVVTGQQVGYLGGPAYTLYKALTAVALARHITTLTGRACVPVFYLVSEDHDLDEIRSAWFLDRSFQLHEFRLEFNADRLPASEVALPDEVESHHAWIVENLRSTKQELVEALRDAYAPGEKLHRAFGRWMLYLLREFGVVVLDPSDPRLKRLARDLFLWEVEERSPSSRALERTSKDLTQLGFSPVIELQGNRLNLFYLENGRHALHVTADGFVCPALGKSWSFSELRKLAEEQPERLSPNVVLRPLLQDILLPTVAYVGGPSEIAYYAQLKPVYEAYGLPMPVIWPRAAFTLIPPPVRRYLARLGIDEARVLREKTLRRAAIADGQMEELTQVVDALRAEIGVRWSEVERIVGGLDPSLRGFVDKAHNRILHTLREIELKAAQASRRRDETLRRQLDAVENTLLPRGQLQERVLNPLTFLLPWDPDLPQRLLDAVELQRHVHKIVDI